MRLPTVLLVCSLLVVSCATGVTSQPKETVSGSPSMSAGSQNTPLSVARRWKLGPVADVAVGPDAVYALYSPATSQGALPNATDTRLARIDRATGVVATAGPFPFAWHIAVAGSAVWIGPNNQYSGTSAPDSRTMVSVDARTLAARQRVTLPADASQLQLIANLASSSDSLWVAYSSHVYRLDSNTGLTLASRSIGGNATSITLDPAGRHLYIGVDGTPSAGGATITEFDAATLARLVSTATGGAGFGGPQVVAGANDVWVSYATGMLGQVEHRRDSNLAALPVSPAVFTNGVHVFEAAGIVWVSDSMAGRLVCLDPRTGAVRVDWMTADVGVVSGDRSAAYLGDINGVSAFRPDPRCG